MKYNYRKMLITILMIIAIILFLNLDSFAHSGRTDSNGGHKDNKNASGLGSYHYHCGGNPPHLHTNGVCPYSSNKTTKSTSSSSNSSTSNTSNKSSTTSSTSSSYSSTTSSASNTNTNSTTTTKPTTITATEIKINQGNCSIEIGETKKLTASITPDNVTNKTITWKSNDESVATVNEIGEVTAKKSGVVSIVASTSNGKIDTIAINVKEKQKIENNTTINTTTSTSNNVSESSNNTEKSNPIGGILTVGLVGAGGYLIFKRKKN